MPLIVTGSIGIDHIEAPTGEAKESLGGSSVYFSAAASFFAPVRLVGAVGDDFPNRFIETIESFKGVDTAGLEIRTGSKTFRWHGKYHENMNHRDTLETQLNVLGEALPPIPEAYRDSKYVFLANTHPAGQLALLKEFPDHTLVVADTMDLWIETERPILLDLLKQIDGLVLNDSEATMLTEESNIVNAADAILKLGPKFVVIKKGEHGALLRHADGHAVLPAYPAANVVDPTGAGDSFAGGMMGSLAASGELSLPSLTKAMACGTVVASYLIEAFSLTKLQEIDRATIDARLNEYRAMMTF